MRLFLPDSTSLRVLRRIPALVLLVLTSTTARGGEKVEFNRDIRPILSENCYYCHGPDKNHREADLRLDIRESAIEHEAIIPGNPEDSELVSRVFSVERTELMPPPKTTKTLSASQKGLLRQWIEEGAEYQSHWAYVPPRRPAVPEVKARDWVRNPIDAFILRMLEAKNVSPSSEADRRTLLRRLSLDLTGLPPSPEEVRRFLDDTASNAYEKQVDRLLDSPQYGERMAVPWLDLARFADTVGYHGDQNQDIFPYRDYVIDSFNRNKPFDQFTIEQLAGDLLPNPTTEQIVATGFNRLNMMTREGGAQPKEYLAKYAADRVRTVAVTWLGSTMGCAECHDHKFDPFTAKDFYSLAAFFADVKQWGVYNDYTYTPNPELRGWTNDHPFPPEIEVESPFLVRHRDRLRREMDELLAKASSRIEADASHRTSFDVWREGVADFLDDHPTGWATPAAMVVGARAREVISQDDGSLLLVGKARKDDEIKVRLRPERGWVAAIRLEVLPDGRHKGQIARDGAAKMQVTLAASLAEKVKKDVTPLPIAFADADHKTPRYANGAEILGVTSGWRTSSQHATARQTSVWLLDRPVRVADGDELIIRIKSDNVGRVRLSLSPIATEDPKRDVIDARLLRDFEAMRDERTPDRVARLHTAYFLSTGRDVEALSRYRALENEWRACRDGRALTMITQACEPRPTRVLKRGNFLDESGELVEPAVPKFLPQPSAAGTRRLNRLDLARWLVAPDNPLTARVFVNRLWKQFFGTGLSAVMEDVGAQGEWPVHPELLDWLAIEFRESGWDVKGLVKLLVMSATYRQDSRGRPGLHEIDPNNRLLAAQSPRRLDAEFIRDNALAIAGLLNLEMGGPSTFPYQPAGYYEYLQFPDRDYIPQRDERQYRRGVYTHWQRTFLHPMLANFDAPSREECTASRTVSNSPQQALTLLNDPTFVEAARVLAQRLVSSHGSDTERLNQLFERALARPIKPKEVPSLLAFLGAQRSLYRSQPEEANKLLHAGIAPVPTDGDPVELAAWTSVCRVVLNLHETITRY
jgi:hypothetical protein